MLDIVITSLMALFGGLNIFQFFFWKSEKKKYAAEADSASADAKQKSIDLQQDQFDFLLEKLTNYQNEYFALAEKMQKEMRIHTELINTKCNEIAELKSKIVYFKGLRCYRSDCSRRIRTNPKMSNEEVPVEGQNTNTNESGS